MDSLSSILKSFFQAIIPIMAFCALIYFMKVSFELGVSGNTFSQDTFKVLVGIFGGVFAGFTIGKLSS